MFYEHLKFILSSMALFSLPLHFPCSVVSKFLVTILNFYTHESTRLPQAPTPIFSTEFRVATAAAAAAPVLGAQRDA